MRAKWEAFIQHYSTCVNLARLNNPHLNVCRDFDLEMASCLEALNISDSEIEPASSNSGQALRTILRERSFDEFSQSHKGRGIELCKEVPSCNKWITNKSGLSKVDYTTALKMRADVCSNKANPGRSTDGTRCRHCDDETETLAHILGTCEFGKLHRNARHHRVRSTIAAAMTKKGFVVHEELGCTAVDGQKKRVDILAYNPATKQGWIIDPTVRFEIGLSQPADVDIDKKQHYDPCVPDLKTRYDLDAIEVIGLLVGARGTIPRFFVNFLKRFNLPKSLAHDITISVLKDSAQIVSNHIYKK
jgi:hypothetical protein